MPLQLPPPSTGLVPVGAFSLSHCLSPSHSQESHADARRGYEELLDKFSLHEFLIRRGATLDTTPEFLSFRRAFEPAWHLIADLIVRLEEVCRRYIVPLAVIDGKVLAEMAFAAHRTQVRLPEVARRVPSTYPNVLPRMPLSISVGRNAGSHITRRCLSIVCCRR